MRTLLKRAQDMIECIRVRPLLQSYLDGDVGSEDGVRISAHLDACRRCGLAAETFRQIKAGLARLAERPDRATLQRLERFVSQLAAH